jgi:hypothetical protein
VIGQSMSQISIGVYVIWGKKETSIRMMLISIQLADLKRQRTEEMSEGGPVGSLLSDLHLQIGQGPFEGLFLTFESVPLAASIPYQIYRRFRGDEVCQSGHWIGR